MRSFATDACAAGAQLPASFVHLPVNGFFLNWLRFAWPAFWVVASLSMGMFSLCCVASAAHLARASLSLFLRATPSSITLGVAAVVGTYSVGLVIPFFALSGAFKAWRNALSDVRDGKPWG